MHEISLGIFCNFVPVPKYMTNTTISLFNYISEAYEWILTLNAWKVPGISRAKFPVQAYALAQILLTPNTHIFKKVWTWNETVLPKPLPARQC